MEKAFKRYTIKAKNLYPVVAVLLHLRVPFEYIPKKKCGMKDYPTMRKTSQIEFELPLDCPFSSNCTLLELKREGACKVLAYVLVLFVPYWN